MHTPRNTYYRPADPWLDRQECWGRFHKIQSHIQPIRRANSSPLPRSQHCKHTGRLGYVSAGPNDPRASSRAASDTRKGFPRPHKVLQKPGEKTPLQHRRAGTAPFFLVQLISAAVTTPCNHTKRSLSTQSYSYCLSPTTSLRAHRPRFAASLFHSIGDSGAYPARPDLRLVVYLTMRRTGMWTVRRRKRQIDQISTLYCMSMLHPLFLSSQKASDDHT